MIAAADEAFRVLSGRAHGRVARREPIAPLTSYQLGGPAEVYLEASSEEDLAALGDALRASGLPLLVVGRGSNMLVSDAGFEGVAVRLGAGFRNARVGGEHLDAGAAMPLPALASLAATETLTGFEFAVAIPASFGGAVAMNAGAHGHSVSEVLEAATVFDLTASERRTLAAEELGFAYRTSTLPHGSIVIAGRLGLKKGDAAAIRGEMKAARDWRRSTQPAGLPNAGSVFKNPPGDAAGRLVEQVCGKGTRAGGARVSEVHANFIVTDPGASAADVYSLIRRIQQEVQENAGVSLETEVKLVGRFDEATGSGNA